MSEELEQKLRAMIVNLRTAGAIINIHVVRGVLAGILRSNLDKFGQFSDFEVIRSWVRSVYHRMNFLEEQLLQVDQSSFGHYRKSFILNIYMTLHQLLKPTIFR